MLKKPNSFSIQWNWERFSSKCAAARGKELLKMLVCETLAIIFPREFVGDVVYKYEYLLAIKMQALN